MYSVYVLEVCTKTVIGHFVANSHPGFNKQSPDAFLPTFGKYQVSQDKASAMLINFQNLIPLIFIRPLRLFIAAEKLRRTRIMLLKITHLPIVGIIWVFERAHEKIRGGASGFSSIGHIGPGSTQLTQDSRIPSKKPRPFLSDRTTVRGPRSNSAKSQTRMEHIVQVRKITRSGARRTLMQRSS